MGASAKQNKCIIFLKLKKTLISFFVIFARNQHNKI